MMESLEVYQENNESGDWVVLHNGERVYSTDANSLSALMGWLRMGQFRDWEGVYFDLEPRR
jgi:hydrogenase maturation factor